MPYAANTERRYDIDWLRCVAVLLLIPFHSLLIFVSDPDSIMYVKDSGGGPAFGYVASFIHYFHMPLLFALSGVSSRYAFRIRSTVQYVRERTLRLFIPAVAGMLTLIPAMTYLTRLSRGEVIPFFTHYFGYFHINGNDLAGYEGNWTPAHLWFIIFLFIFSIFAVPLFVLIRRGEDGMLMKNLDRFMSGRLAVLLPGILFPLAAWPEILGDKNPIVYFLYFVTGYALMTGPGFRRAVVRDLPVVGVLAISVNAVLTLVFEGVWSSDLPEIVLGFLYHYDRWLLLLTILGVGELLLNHGSKVLKYLSSSAMPFYVLHLPINTLIAFFVVRWSAPYVVKYLFIVCIATVLTFAVYEVVRRIGPLAFALGMKIHRSNSAASVKQTDT